MLGQMGSRSLNTTPRRTTRAVVLGDGLWHVPFLSGNPPVLGHD